MAHVPARHDNDTGLPVYNNFQTTGNNTYDEAHFLAMKLVKEKNAIEEKKNIFPRFNKYTLGLCHMSAGVEFMLRRNVSGLFAVNMNNMSTSIEGRYYFDAPVTNNRENAFAFLRGSTRNNLAFGFGISDKMPFSPKFGVTYNTVNKVSKPFVSLEFNW